jgi:hypothetical protein
MSRQSLNRSSRLRIDAETAIVVLVSRHGRENIVYMVGAERSPRLGIGNSPFKSTTMSPTHQIVLDSQIRAGEENRNLRLKPKLRKE